MLLKKYPVIIGCLTFLGFSVTSFAQEVMDTSFRQKAIRNLIQFYHSSIGTQSHLYNAPLYERHIPRFTSGHPFFSSDSFSIGTIGYDGLAYNGLPVLYDIVRDELITLSPNGFSIALIKPKVDSFFFDGHSFIKLKDDASAVATQSYYERLWNGNTGLFAKRKKTIQESSGNTTLERRVYAQDRYYIRRVDGVFETIKNKNSLLGVLKDKKSALQQFIKQNNLKFKQSFEEDAARVVAYYNQLN